MFFFLLRIFVDDDTCRVPCASLAIVEQIIRDKGGRTAMITRWKLGSCQQLPKQTQQGVVTGLVGDPDDFVIGAKRIWVVSDEDERGAAVVLKDLAHADHLAVGLVHALLTIITVVLILVDLHDNCETQGRLEYKIRALTGTRLINWAVIHYIWQVVIVK